MSPVLLLVIEQKGAKFVFAVSEVPVMRFSSIDASFPANATIVVVMISPDEEVLNYAGVHIQFIRAKKSWTSRIVQVIYKSTGSSSLGMYENSSFQHSQV